MASTTLAKATYCLAGVGVLLGGGYAAKTLIIGDRIDDLLRAKNPKYQLLATNSSVDRWKKSWLKYREDNKGKDKDAWNLADWKKEDKIDESARAPASFIDACETKSQKRVTKIEDPLFQEVLKWCTGDSTIKDLIRDVGKRTLTDKDPKEDEKYGWKPLWKTYFDAYKNQGDNPLDIDGLNDSSDEKAKVQKFIDKCKALSETVVVGTTDPTYEKVNLHCSANIRAEDLVRESYSNKKLINLTKAKQDAKGTSLSESIWSKYSKNSNDSWGISKSQYKSTMPDNFWDKCEEKRKTEVKDTEDKVFKEVLSYCTVEGSDAKTYEEIVK